MKTKRGEIEFSTIIGVLLIIAAAIGVFIISDNSSKNAEKSREATRERYVAAVAKWIEVESPSTSATKRKEIAECAYKKDPDVLYIRSQLKAEEEQRNEGHIIQSSSYHGYGDFVSDLESYVNGGDGKILKVEASRIKDAISNCK